MLAQHVADCSTHEHTQHASPQLRCRKTGVTRCSLFKPKRFKIQMQLGSKKELKSRTFAAYRIVGGVIGMPESIARLRMQLLIYS